MGLRYCDINMTKPGLYVLGYTASYNDGPRAYAERYLVVEANCASGEVRRARAGQRQRLAPAQGRVHS